jgi:hypothetical protein
MTAPQSDAAAPASSPAPARALLARRALTAALLLGILADPMLRDMPWGLGLLVWIAALAAAVVTLVRQADGTLSGESLTWLTLAVAFAAGLSWHDADTVLAFDFIAMLVSLTLLAMSLNAIPVPRLAAARVRDLIVAAFGTGLEVGTGAVPLVLRDADLAAAAPPESAGKARQIARALVITIPVLFVFTLLLRNADPVFRSYFTFPNIQLDVLFSHVVIAAVFAWIVAGWLRRALLAPPRGAAPVERPFAVALGTMDVGLALGALNVLFAAFVIVQVGWLYGGEALVMRTTGLSYAEYARRGFFELLGVAALLLPVLLVAQALIPQSDTRAAALYRRLSAVLVLLLGAIMLSAGARMKLYVHYYGISVDRLYASAFMIWLAMVFVWLAVTVLRSRPRPFAVGMIASGMTVLLTLNMMNPDGLVARYNLARAGTEISTAAGADPSYLATLGGDAVPALVDALTAPAVAATLATPADRCAAAERLLNKWTGERYERASAHWMQWNAGRAAAARAVSAHEAELKQMVCAKPPDTTESVPEPR